ncbi:hypothetical protein Hanom_Chr09g00780131 [Helianthus anomalus]
MYNKDDYSDCCLLLLYNTHTHTLNTLPLSTLSQGQTTTYRHKHHHLPPPYPTPTPTHTSTTSYHGVTIKIISFMESNLLIQIWNKSNTPTRTPAPSHEVASEQEPICNLSGYGVRLESELVVVEAIERQPKAYGGGGD